MSHKQYWPVVAARVPPELKSKLIAKHPNDGDISSLLRQLIEKYLQGKIFGITLPIKKGA